MVEQRFPAALCHFEQQMLTQQQAEHAAVRYLDQARRAEQWETALRSVEPGWAELPEEA